MDRDSLLRMFGSRAQNLVAVIYGGLTLQIAVESPLVHISVIKRLLDREGQVNVLDGSGTSVLHKALNNRRCQIDVIKLLLDHGAPVRTSNKLGVCPLHVAVLNPHCDLEVVRLLIVNGAGVNSVNIMGQSPLSYALSNQKLRPDMINLLLLHGARIQQRTTHLPDYYPLKQAIHRNNSNGCDANSLECVKLMLKFAILKSLSFQSVKFIAEGSRNYRELRRFASECVRELRGMESEIISPEVTLRDFVSKPQGWLFHTLCDLEQKKFDNWKITRLFRVLMLSKWPLYADVLSFKVMRSAMFDMLKELLRKVAVSSKEHCVDKNAVVLNRDSLLYLAKYLPNDDLLNFVFVLLKTHDSYTGNQEWTGYSNWAGIFRRFWATCATKNIQ